MAYNNRNKLMMYKNIVDIVNMHYEEGVTTYAGIWRKHIYPVYFIGYGTFMKIMNTDGLDSKIQQYGRPPASARVQPNQLSLF